MIMLQRFIWNSHKNSCLITMELLLPHSREVGCGCDPCRRISLWQPWLLVHNPLCFNLQHTARYLLAVWCARTQHSWREGSCSASNRALTSASLRLPSARLHPQCWLTRPLTFRRSPEARAVIRQEELQTQEEMCAGKCPLPLPWVSCRETEAQTWVAKAQEIKHGEHSPVRH